MSYKTKCCETKCCETKCCKTKCCETKCCETKCCELLDCCGELNFGKVLTRQYVINVGEKLKNDSEFQKLVYNLKKCLNEKNYNCLVKFLDNFYYKHLFKPVLDLYKKKCYCKILKILKNGITNLYFDDNDTLVYNSAKPCENTFCNYYNKHITTSHDVVGYLNKNVAFFTDKYLIVSTVTGSTNTTVLTGAVVKVVLEPVIGIVEN